MKKPISKILSMIVATATMVTMATGCTKEETKPKNEMGQVDESSKVELVQGDEDNASLPFYDVGNIPISYNKASLESLNTYYRQLLPTRLAIVYNDIRSAALENKDVVNLSKTITEEELFQIISIMHIDDIECFNMESKYSYTKNESGYVSKVFLEYFANPSKPDMSSLDYLNDVMEKIEASAVGHYSIMSAAKEDEKKESNIKNESIDYNAAIYLMDVAKGVPRSDFINSESRNVARAYSYYCRYVGIPCMVKMGKLTDTEMMFQTSSGSNILSLSDVAKATTFDEESQKYTVDYSYDDYYFWNIIQINGNWYNVDIMMNNFLSTSDGNGFMSKIDWMSFCPDYIISMSRISQYSDVILGESPSCTDNQFLSIYRQGDYILSHNQAQMKARIEDMISLYKGAGEEEYTYQFEDEETYKLIGDGETDAVLMSV